MLNRARLVTLLMITGSYSAVVHADDDASVASVGFDRPGIGFSTNIMPPNGVAWEQGLPDFSYDKQSLGGKDYKTTLYQADTLIRTGLVPNVELQLGWAGPMWSKESAAASTHKQHGYGDSSIGVKFAVPLPQQAWTLAFLGASTLTTGDGQFGDEKRTLSFGSTVNYALTEHYSAALYANVDRYDGDNTWTVSPSVSASISDTFGTFLEYGYSKSKGQSQQSVLGGGVTWMVHPRIQLDLSADVAVNNNAPDVQGGFGISVVMP